jgi:hypothetical protein
MCDLRLQSGVVVFVGFLSRLEVPECFDHVLKADAFGDFLYFINNGRPAGGADIGGAVSLRAYPSRKDFAS